MVPRIVHTATLPVTLLQAVIVVNTAGNDAIGDEASSAIFSGDFEVEKV